MSRPTKCRTICYFPQTVEFIPVRGSEGKEPVILTVDEFETVQLIDREGLSQEQCSLRMQVARTTAQKIYDSARRKLADALVEGLPLRIEGGECRPCDGSNPFCLRGGCYKQVIYQTYQRTKGEMVMRIAVTYEDGRIFQHFGRTEQFKVYDAEDGKIISSEVVSTDGKGHGALAEVLNALQADVLICGGIGGGAQAALASAGIQLYGGVNGDADAAVEAFLAGTLEYVPDISCSHHGEGHHGEGCGGHHHEESHACRQGHCAD